MIIDLNQKDASLLLYNRARCICIVYGFENCELPGEQSEATLYYEKGNVVYPYTMIAIRW